MPGLGDEFRAAREARHLSLSDVSDQIHIRSVYLQSIENEDWSSMAAPVYVRGFIRTYARFLGLEPEVAVERYNAELDEAEREADGPVRVAPARRGPSIWVWLAGAAAVVLLAFVAYNYYQLQTSQALPNGAESSDVGIASPLPTPSASASAPASAAVPGGDLVASPEPSPSASLSASPRTLEIVVSAPAWVRVRIDGRTRLEGTYPPGTRRTFQGKSADIRVGNAGGVDVIVNGKDLGTMGPSGEVVEQTYTLGEG